MRLNARWRVDTWRELGIALRSLARRPGFSLTAIALAGVGIGAMAIATALVDAVLHPRSPYADPSTLLVANYRAFFFASRANSFEVYRSFVQDQAAEIPTAIAATRRASVRAGVITRVRSVSYVSPDFFDVVGVHPVTGRLFTSTSGDGTEVAVVSEDLWARDLAHVRPAQVSVNGRSYDVIGTVPQLLSVTQRSSVWLPIAPMDLATGQGIAWPTVFVRAPRSDAINRIKEALKRASALNAARFGEQVQPLEVRDGRPDPLGANSVQLALLSGAALIWIIACVNLAGLMIASGLARRREFAVRVAIGAQRSSIVMQVTLEALVLSAAGAIMGFLLCAWASDVLTTQMPSSVHSLGIAGPQIGWRVFAAVAVVAGLSAAFFGCLPALVVSAVDSAAILKEEGSTSVPRRRWPRDIVTLQVALSMALVVNAMLLGKTVLRLSSFDYGFEANSLLVSDVPGPNDTGGRPIYSQAAADAEMRLIALRNLPGVAAAVLWNEVVPHGGVAVATDAGSGRVLRLAARGYVWTTPEVLQVLGVRLLEGRAFVEEDRAGSGVAIVDEQTAASLWPGQVPIGHLVRLGDRAQDPIVPVVGVIPRVRLHFPSDPDEPAPPVVFVVPPRSRGSWNEVVIRARGGVGPAMAIVERAYRDLPGSSLVSVRTWTADIESFLAARRFLAAVFVVIGAAGLFLTASGLYAASSRGVVERLREFGIRLALGAAPRTVFLQVVRETGGTIGAGLILGGLLALWSGRLIEVVLYDVSAMDGVSFLFATVFILVIGLGAAVVPSARAAGVRPAELLRV